jgi:hypothetical protein
MMGFIVKQMMDDPIILITYRRFDSTVDEATRQAKKIGELLREIGDFGYIILDISGHRNSFRTLYDTLQDVLKENSGKISNPSQSIIMVGSSALVDYHQAETQSHKTERFAWIVTNDASHAMELAQAKIDAGEHPANANQF